MFRQFISLLFVILSVSASAISFEFQNYSIDLKSRDFNGNAAIRISTDLTVRTTLPLNFKIYAVAIDSEGKGKAYTSCSITARDKTSHWDSIDLYLPYSELDPTPEMECYKIYLRAYADGNWYCKDYVGDYYMSTRVGPQSQPGLNIVREEPAFEENNSVDDIIRVEELRQTVVVEECPGTPAPVDDNKIFENVEEDPQFPGGLTALMKYVADHMRYPSTAQEHSIEGRVVVQFVVTKTGSIGAVKVIRSKDPDLDKEAVRIVKSLPKFTPGRMCGKPVNTWYTLPITFKLQS